MGLVPAAVVATLPIRPEPLAAVGSVSGGDGCEWSARVEYVGGRLAALFVLLV